MTNGRLGKQVTIWACIVLLGALMASCKVTLGAQELRLRVGMRAPAMVTDEGNGEQIILPELDPEGDTLLLFARGTW